MIRLKKIIITFDPIIIHYNDNGFCIMNIFDFLLDKNISILEVVKQFNF